MCESTSFYRWVTRVVENGDRERKRDRNHLVGTR